MFICKICNIAKPAEEFYKNSKKKCKSCTCLSVRKNRLDKIDYYQLYDRDRANNPDRVLARELYSKTEAGIAASNKAKIKWLKTNLIKRAASHIVNNAIRDGKLTKQYFCSECGNTHRIHGHHDDYAYPLVVRWLCSKCHCNWHKINGEGKNG